MYFICRYGLIKPAKKDKKQVNANVFGSDDSSDDEKPKRKTRTSDLSSTQKKQAQKIQDDALASDPTVFQYDEVYDDIENKRKEAKIAKKTEVKKAKYIEKLLETADKRKKEQERRVERQVQKDREAEGEEFKDKESFVTSAYRAKLEEMKEAEDAEKREEYLETIGDVTKQQDLSGFYRHIYEQKIGEEKEVPKKPEEPEVKTDQKSDKKERQSKESSKEDSKKKNYRKRKSSGEKDEKSDDENETSKDKKNHLQSNLDADSDFSIDSSSSGSDSEDDKEKSANGDDVKKETPDSDGEKKPEQNGKNGKGDDSDDDKKNTDETEEKPPPPEPKVKIDIWKKRTVGDVFDQAQQRYYERKALREQQ